MPGSSNLAKPVIGLVALVALGCASANPGAADPVVDPIQIDSVDVRVLESSPPQAVAHVQGILGDGCSEFHSLSQSRSGSTITVTILRQRPRDAICTQIAKLYEADIPLEGQYPPGRYVLRVNGVEKVFTTE
jgi:hypothetical protein